MSNKKRMPMVHMVHYNNHTQVERVGSVATTHLSDENIINTLEDWYVGKQYNELHTGLYKVWIRNYWYVLDVFRDLSNDDYLQIDAYNKAFIRWHLTYEDINLYRIDAVGHELLNGYVITNTVNDAFDMLIVDGYTEESGTPSLNNPATITSISSLTFKSTGVKTDPEEVTMNLKTYIKALPNGIKDCCIINSEQQKYHIIGRVGRTIFSGYESWEELTNYCTDNYCVYYCPNSNVAVEDTSDNLRCTHLTVTNSSNLLSKSTEGNYIATCGDSSIGNGFLIKIDKTQMDYASNDPNILHFQEWLNNIFLSGACMVVEYPLSYIDFKELLLEEYHVPTFYSNTTLYLTSNDDCNVSYFYKYL